MLTETSSEIERKFYAILQRRERNFKVGRQLALQILDFWDRNEDHTDVYKDVLARSERSSRRQHEMDAQMYDIAISVGNIYPKITRNVYEHLTGLRDRQKLLVDSVKEDEARGRYAGRGSEYWIKRMECTDEQIRQLLKGFFDGATGEVAASTNDVQRPRRRPQRRGGHVED